MTTTIKLDDPNTLALVRSYKTQRDREIEELTAYKAEVEAKLEEMRAAGKEVHKAFWKKLEEIAPATAEGNWSMDTDYIDEGLVFLRRKEEKADDDKGASINLRALLKALGGDE